MKDIIYSRIFWLLFNNNFKKQIAVDFNSFFAKETMKCAKVNYDSILRNSQLVGKNNPKLTDLLFTVLVAAIYKAGKGKISIAQMDFIITNSMEASYVFRKSFGKDDHFSKSWQDKRHLQAIVSQKREYPSDFVYDFIYGETYDEYGIHYYECAIYKLLKQENCSELTPLFCKFDYVMAKHMGATLKRTKTIVAGGNFCDFWYTKER